MADPELARKLAKRLEATKVEDEEEPIQSIPPPPCPVIPQKIIDNPYIPSDPVSIDDLITKTLAKEENNNNPTNELVCQTNSSLTSPILSPTSSTTSAASPKGVPPKTTIRDLLLKDQPQPPPSPPINKTPLVPIEHHKKPQSQCPIYGPKIPADDGSELERRLAEQRTKKQREALKAAENKELSFEELEKQIAKELEQERVEIKPENGVEAKTETPADPEPPKKEEPIKAVLPEPPRKFVPSPLLMEAIRQECGPSVRSPPPNPPPKPHTPTGSRPDSPIVKKPLVSSLGLLCDPLMSVDSKTPLSPPPIKKPVPKAENPEELNEALERRNKIIEGEDVPERINKKLSLYAEFDEFSRKQIQAFIETFKKFDEDHDNFIDFMELKRMMEKLGEAQTHIALKEMIKKVDEDRDGKISLREFILIFRLASQGKLGCSEVFNQLAESIDVAKEGVQAAASFFQAKIAEQTKMSKFEEEIRQEQEERKKEEAEKKERREKFLQNKSIFH